MGGNHVRASDLQSAQMFVATPPAFVASAGSATMISGLHAFPPALQSTNLESTTYIQDVDENEEDVDDDASDCF